MKRVGFIVSILTVFFIASLAFVQAAGCSLGSYSNETILSLYAPTNSHLALWNDSVQTSYEACFNSTFGFSYTDQNPGVDVHACNPDYSNVVVWLSGIANAHAYPPTTTPPVGYPVPVCYAGLTCELRTNSCRPGYQEVISLSYPTNAHAELSDSNVYNNLVCCSYGASAGWGTKWQDSKGDLIGVAYGKASAVNKTVQMIATTNLGPGKVVNFSVYEKDWSNPDDFIRNFSAVTNAQGVATVSNFFITDQDMINGGINSLEPGYLQFYFTAASGAQDYDSELLYVNGTESNTPPSVSISGPTHRAIYYKGTTIQFNASVIDDGMISSYLWKIAEDGFQSSQKNFSYTLQTEGQKTITLKVTDNKGVSDEKQIAIAVVASPGGMAFVNQPRHLQTLVNSLLQVSFSANESYIINSVGSPCPTTVTCLAGNCPTHTENTPNGCSPSTLTVAGTPQPFTSAYFNWAFSDGDNGAAMDGFGNTAATKRFGLPSSSEGDKRVDLIVNYTNAGTGVGVLRTTSRFFTLLDARQCVDNGNTWIEYNETSGEETTRYSTLTTGRCSGKDGLFGSSDDCCPVGWACSTGGCNPTNITKCADYSNKTSCNKDALNVVKNDPFWNSIPKCGEVVNGVVTTCSCLWNGTSETSGSCGLNKSSTSSGGTTGGCTYSSCYYSTSSTGECVNGYATIQVIAGFTNGTCAGGITEDQCVSGPRTVLCGKPTVALSFFGVWQFIASFLFIGVVYFLITHRKR